MEAWLWLGIGLMLSRSLGKGCDQSIQQSDWFENLGPFWKWLAKSLLDFLHHWWMGLILVVYYPDSVPIVWFGWGMFIDDMPDVPKRIRKYFAYLKG